MLHSKARVSSRADKFSPLHIMYMYENKNKHMHNIYNMYHDADDVINNNNHTEFDHNQIRTDHVWHCCELEIMVKVNKSGSEQVH